MLPVSLAALDLAKLYPTTWYNIWSNFTFNIQYSSEEEQSSFTDIEDQSVTPAVQIATITPIEHVADNTSSVCPVHGMQNVFDTVMTDGNEIHSLQDTVKTFLLSSEYPHDITLEMINRFCSVPLKRLVVKLTEPDRLKPTPVTLIKDCTIKLQRLTVDTTPEEQLDITSSDETPEQHDDPVVQNTDEPIMTDGNNFTDNPPLNEESTTSTRPKRNGTQIKSYVESTSGEDDTKTTSTPPRPKRKITTLRSPSASRMAAQKSKKDNIKPTVLMLSSPSMTRSRTSKIAWVPPKLRPRNTKEKHKVVKAKVRSATPAKPKLTSSTVDQKGDLDIKFKGLPKYKKPRKFTCKVCNSSFTSQALLNAHHIQDHQPVKCPDCTKTFVTPSTLARHSYIHKPLKYCCDHCPERYAFQSALGRHLTSHHKYPTFICHHKNCCRAYFSNSELIKHVRVHNRKIWRCHLRKHSEQKPYVCGVCGKGHRYHIQFVRHVKNDNCDGTVKA